MTVKDAVAFIAPRYNLDPVLLAAQVLVESSGRPDAFRYEPAFYAHYIVGHGDAAAARFGPLAACSYGLLQILLETACELGFTGPPHDLFVPEVGLDWGAHHLKTLLDWAAGDVVRALCAYNGGKHAAYVKPYATQGYADKVLAFRGHPLP